MAWNHYKPPTLSQLVQQRLQLPGDSAPLPATHEPGAAASSATSRPGTLSFWLALLDEDSVYLYLKCIAWERKGGKQHRRKIWET